MRGGHSGHSSTTLPHNVRKLDPRPIIGIEHPLGPVFPHRAAPLASRRALSEPTFSIPQPSSEPEAHARHLGQAHGEPVDAIERSMKCKKVA